MFEAKEMLVSFLFHILNAVILFFILRKFLFKPVKKFLDKREEKYKARNDDIIVKETEVEEMGKQYTVKLNSAKEEARMIIETARDEAVMQSVEIEHEARDKARDIIFKGRDRIEDEKREAMEDLKTDTARMAVDIASKVLKKNINAEDNMELVEEFLDRVK